MMMIDKMKKYNLINSNSALMNDSTYRHCVVNIILFVVMDNFIHPQFTFLKVLKSIDDIDTKELYNGVADEIEVAMSCSFLLQRPSSMCPL